MQHVDVASSRRCSTNMFYLHLWSHTLYALLPRAHTNQIDDPAAAPRWTPERIGGYAARRRNPIGAVGTLRTCGHAAADLRRARSGMHVPPPVRISRAAWRLNNSPWRDGDSPGAREFHFHLLPGTGVTWQVDQGRTCVTVCADSAGCRHMRRGSARAGPAVRGE
jgi:hypothetical protein